jgi:uncharacterized protein
MIKKIEKIAQKYFNTARGSHDWSHTNRVANLALHLAELEHADKQVVHIAALLHDIGRETQDNSHGKICHAEESTRLAKEILPQFHLPENTLNNILHAIEAHRFRNAHIPETIEAKVLYDADKLDSIGAIGIGRAFLFAGEIGATVHNKYINLETAKAYSKEDTAYREFLVKLSKVQERMMTNSGKKIAKKRHQFMVEFFERINLEVDGIK